MFTVWQNFQRVTEVDVGLLSMAKAEKSYVTSTTSYCQNNSSDQPRVKDEEMLMGAAAKNLHPHLMYHIGVSIGYIDTFIILFSILGFMFAIFHNAEKKGMNFKWSQWIHPSLGILQRPCNQNHSGSCPFRTCLSSCLFSSGM